MRESQDLYQYLYQVLASQILSGTFLQGQKFPAQREICLQYNVGITTVRRVMKMLDKHGYIRTAQGQPSVVTYQASGEVRAAFLIQRQEEIADAYRGLGLLMPVLYCEGAKLCGEPELRVLRGILERVSEQTEPPVLYRQANAFFITLLRPLKNQLILDLELDSENYLHVPHPPLPGVEHPFALTAGRLKTRLENALTQIGQKQFDAFYDSAVNLYRIAAKRADDYFRAVSKYTSARPQAEENIHWFRIKGHSELYTRLAMTIVRRIISGEFDGEKYLPSIPKLMDEYEVMKNTASRAVALLNSLGFAQTIDKKGSIITLKGAAAVRDDFCLAQPVVHERLSLFLDALQIVALTARSCAASIPSVPENLAISIEDRLWSAPENMTSPLSFQQMINCFIRLLPCHSLKNIFRQLDDLLIWGHYLQAVDESLYPDYIETAAAAGAVLDALKKPDTNDLPDAFGKVFSLTYQDVCRVISKMPDAFKYALDSGKKRAVL